VPLAKLGVSVPLDIARFVNRVSGTIAEAVPVAVAEPTEFVFVTFTRKYLPMSAVPSESVDDVAPAMGLQVEPLLDDSH